MVLCKLHNNMGNNAISPSTHRYREEGPSQRTSTGWSKGCNQPSNKPQPEFGAVLVLPSSTVRMGDWRRGAYTRRTRLFRKNQRIHPLAHQGRINRNYLPYVLDVRMEISSSTHPEVPSGFWRAGTRIQHLIPAVCSSLEMWNLIQAPRGTHQHSRQYVIRANGRFDQIRNRTAAPNHPVRGCATETTWGSRDTGTRNRLPGSAAITETTRRIRWSKYNNSLDRNRGPMPSLVKDATKPSEEITHQSPVAHAKRTSIQPIQEWREPTQQHC